MSSGDDFESYTGRWRRQQKRNVRVSTLVTGTVVAVFLLSAALLVAYVAWQNRNSRLEEAQLRARGTTAILAQLYADAAQSHGFGHGTFGGMRLLLENWFAKNSADKDLAWAYVRDEKGHIVAGRMRSHLLPDAPQKASDEALRSWFFKQQDQGLKGFLKPSIKLQRSDGGPIYGEVMIGYSLARINRDFYQQLIISALGGLLAVVLLSLLMLSILRKLVLKPLKLIAESMDQVRDGRLDTRAEILRGDEIGALAHTFNFMVEGLADRDRLEDAFQRYVSRQVLDKIRASGEDLQLLGESRKATILFSDIRGFTSMNERLTPEQVVSGLNEYFTEMVDVIFRYDGFINKFVGDAIMAVWGAPFDQDHAELRAVQAALEMFSALEALNQRRQKRGEAILKIGVGINTGSVVSGNIGHVARMEYTVIGDAVNVAQRIESQTKILGKKLLISRDTFLPIQDWVVSEEMPKVIVKGRQQAIQLYAIEGLRPEAQLPALAASSSHTSSSPASSSAEQPNQISPQVTSAQPAEESTALSPVPEMPAPASTNQRPQQAGESMPGPGQDQDLIMGIHSPLTSSEMTLPQAGPLPAQAFPEVTVPASVAPALVRASTGPDAMMNKTAAAHAQQDMIAESTLTESPQAIQNTMPIQPSTQASGEFSDPVTSQVYEAKFFHTAPSKMADSDNTEASEAVKNNK